MSKLSIAVSVALLLGLAAPRAQANGRFPQSTAVKFHPGQTDTIIVPVTFGLLVSTDGGAHFDWICEQAVGYVGTYDPVYAVAADGAVLATNFEGVRIARNGFCSWDAVPDLANQWVSDIKVDSDGKVWASTFTLSSGYENNIFVSTDNGATFSPSNLARNDVAFRSVLVAPSDPTRLYTVGQQVIPATADAGFPTVVTVGFRSENGGQSWTPLNMDSIIVGNTPQVVMEAVAPDDPDVLYARSEKSNVPSGDILYRSIDKGQSWTEVLRTSDIIRAMLVQAGGKVIVGTLNDGVRISEDGGDTWMMPTEQPPMNCLGVRSDGLLFACGLNWAPSYFALATSTDGQTWTPMMRFCDIRGPLSCPAGSIQADTCVGDRWGMVKVSVSVGDCSAPPGADAGVSLADAAIWDGGSSGVDAGMTEPKKGCTDCSNGDPAGAAFILLLLVLVIRRRRANI